MIASTLLLPIHPCTSIDLHTHLPPPPIPPVPPFLPYFWLQVLGGLPFFTKAKICKKTFAWHFPAMQKGTDIGRMLIHVGNPINLKLPFIIYNSSSKSFFGASTVKVENQVVAVSNAVVVNNNMNCNDPMNLPTGVVIAPNTVMAGMTIGDFLAGYVNITTDLLVGKALGKPGDYMGKKIIGKLANSAVTKSAWEAVTKSKLGKTMAEEVTGESVNALTGLGFDKIKDVVKNKTGFDLDSSIGDNIGRMADDSLEGTGAQEAAGIFTSVSKAPSYAANNIMTSGINAIGNFFSGGEQF